ncbi:MAG: hypothetical protein QN172_09875 [Armatimonadota bacterium]|nr:hypothetical protein [Armatimonadota bacterium]MDR7439325.1 hypothetical protein [Armatimonadota bacterium]MDR7562015.1 hypothetical protein [Armatimonadota bacterium]MDR7567011.1 hypothetical protein [Armatimonadota bacterium]MDR7602747.1 hypothetical protein [Armatimonadota bacterium]
MRAWKALLATGSLLASVVGWGVLAARDATVAAVDHRGPAVEEAPGTWSEAELEPLPPVPSVRRPVATTRSSR